MSGVLARGVVGNGLKTGILVVDTTTRFDSSRGRIAALRKHALYDARSTTAPAREAFLDRFEREVEREAEARGEALGPREIARRAECAKRAYFSELAAKSAAARRRQ